MKKNNKKSAEVASTSVSAQAAQNVSHALSSKACLLKLTSGTFIGNPRDKKLTAEVEADHNTEAKRISVRKKIMQDKRLSKVLSEMQSLRLLADKLSSPWLDGGFRIIPAKQIVPIKTELEAKIREVMALADIFVAAYDDIIAADRTALNGTFNILDYPSKSELRAKFYAEVELFPIPSDFRVEGIDEKIRSEVQAKIDETTSARVSEAKRNLLERIATEVRHLKDRLSANRETARFHNSAVSNVAEVCANVQRINFDDDPTINQLAAAVTQAITMIDPDKVRDNDQARNDAKELTEKLLSTVDETMSAFML